MDKRSEVTKHINRQMHGIEIGPWFCPMAPKLDGFDCLVVDIVDAAALRDRARLDSNIPSELITNIEEVDLLGSAVELEAIVEAKSALGSFDYILSSHNFEHLPNPIRFLQGCGNVLKAGGILSLAVPDKRGCFDYFRPPTTPAQFIDAYFENRERPTFAQIFDANSLHARYQHEDALVVTWAQGVSPTRIRALPGLAENFAWWAQKRREADTGYIDIHCWAFTPSSFELILRDLRFLGLSTFDVIEITPTGREEFYVHLQNNIDTKSPDENLFYETRQALLHRINSELGAHSIPTADPETQIQALTATIQQLINSIQERDVAVTEAITRTHMLEGQVQSLAQQTAQLSAERDALATRSDRWFTLHRNRQRSS